MIHEAAEELANHEFQIVRQYNDDCGTVGYELGYNDDSFVLVAKEYAYEGKASFIASLVTSHHRPDYYIFYCDEEETYRVFDGEFVRRRSDESHGPSKKRDASWREISLECGVDLEDFVRGEEVPRTLAGNNQTLGTFS